MPFSSRRKDLELIIPLKAYCNLEVMLSAHLLSNLVQLKVLVYDDHQFPGPLEPSLNLFQSPKLQRVWMCPSHIFNNNLQKVFLPWQITTYLSKQRCTVLAMVTILKSCPYLVCGNFGIFDEFPATFTETISLPYLQALSVQEVWVDSAFVDDFCIFVHAPQLRWLEYRNEGSRRHDVVRDDIGGSSILPLIERTTGLKKLALNRSFFSPPHFIRLIQATSVNSLRKLILDSTLFITREDPFDLSCLIANIDSNYIGLFLPRLEDFELHQTWESDSTVLSFIVSRMNTSSNLDISVLQRVKVIFRRQKELKGIDIRDQVEALAAKADIQINLTLDYAPPPALISYDNVLSPSYVSNYPSATTLDRTWEYDIEMDDEDCISRQFQEFTMSLLTLSRVHVVGLEFLKTFGKWSNLQQASAWLQPVFVELV